MDETERTGQGDAARSTGVTPAVVAFVGHSGSGKTTLLEGVLRDLVGRGLRVGTIKHDPKGHAAYDHPGKDSWRHRQAGAAVAALAGPATVATFRDAAGDEWLPALARRLAADTPLDLVLAEGYHTQTGFPKIEVYRPSLGRPPRCAAEELLAVAADTPDLAAALAGPPRLPLDDPPAVARFLLERFLPGRRVRPPSQVPAAPPGAEQRRRLGAAQDVIGYAPVSQASLAGTPASGRGDQPGRPGALQDDVPRRAAADGRQAGAGLGLTVPAPAPCDPAPFERAPQVSSPDEP